MEKNGAITMSSFELPLRKDQKVPLTKTKKGTKKSSKQKEYSGRVVSVEKKEIEEVSAPSETTIQVQTDEASSESWSDLAEKQHDAENVESGATGESERSQDTVVTTERGDVTILANRSIALRKQTSPAYWGAAGKKVTVCINTATMDNTTVSKKAAGLKITQEYNGRMLRKGGKVLFTVPTEGEDSIVRNVRASCTGALRQLASNTKSDTEQLAASYEPFDSDWKVDMTIEECERILKLIVYDATPKADWKPYFDIISVYLEKALLCIDEKRTPNVSLALLILLSAYFQVPHTSIHLQEHHEVRKDLSTIRGMMEGTAIRSENIMVDDDSHQANPRNMMQRVFLSFLNSKFTGDVDYHNNKITICFTNGENKFNIIRSINHVVMTKLRMLVLQCVTKVNIDVTSNNEPPVWMHYNLRTFDELRVNPSKVITACLPALIQKVMSQTHPYGLWPSFKVKISGDDRNMSNAQLESLAPLFPYFTHEGVEYEPSIEMREGGVIWKAKGVPTRLSAVVLRDILKADDNKLLIELYVECKKVLERSIDTSENVSVWFELAGEYHVVRFFTMDLELHPVCASMESEATVEDEAETQMTISRLAERLRAV